VETKRNTGELKTVSGAKGSRDSSPHTSAIRVVSIDCTLCTAFEAKVGKVKCNNTHSTDEKTNTSVNNWNMHKFKY
jgi:hypothetical protein